MSSILKDKAKSNSLAVRRRGRLSEVSEGAGVLGGVNTTESELAIRIIGVAPTLRLEVDTKNLGGLQAIRKLDYLPEILRELEAYDSAC